MKKVAIVVQRCHETVVGGSEALAWNYATLLRNTYDVDVLTTTATDISEWANALPEGREEKDGISIIRFRVTVGRNAYWAQLYDRLRAGFNPFTPGRHRNGAKSLRLHWTLALQEEFIKNQGPYSEPLLNYIRENWHEYHSIIFVTYLYPTTYFGLHQLPAGRALFAPTLHDEQPAYLSAFKHAAHRAGRMLWLTEAEGRVGQKLWGDLPGTVVGMSVETDLREPERSSIPYLLYCGRVDPNKGCAHLFEFYFKYKRATRSKLRLVITGTADMEIPPHPDIDFRGFVSAEEKFRLMAGASVFVIPSPNESFSIVTLEAMAQQTQVLASSASEVMADHIDRSGAGRTYTDYYSFENALHDLLADESGRRALGKKGREYVTRHYTEENIRRSLIQVLEKQERANNLRPLLVKHELSSKLRPSRPPSPTSSQAALSTIIQNPHSSSSASHMLTLNIGNQMHKISLIRHGLEDDRGGYLFVRPLTHDTQIVEDVASHNEYGLPNRFMADDIVIDIGAHVGAFSYAVLNRGAGKVYSYEAHPANHAIAFHNVSKFGDRVICRNLAVWRSDEPDRILYNDVLQGLDQPNTGGISVLWNNEGVPVQSVSLDELLREASEEFKKPVRLLKLDCEGAEYPILFTSSHLEIVREICGEYHKIPPDEVPARAQVGSRRDQFNGAGLRQHLEAQGFSVELEPHSETVGVFHARRRSVE